MMKRKIVIMKTVIYKLKLQHFGYFNLFSNFHFNMYFRPITTKALKTTKIHQQKMQFLKGLSRTTQRVPSHGSWTPLGKPQTIMQRTTLKSCDSPPICGRNCGVVIDPNGCQSCDCLWRSKSKFQKPNFKKRI